MLSFFIACGEKKYNSSVFWKIKNNNTDETSYVLGTIHKLDTNFINFPAKELKNIAKKCDLICVESLPEQTNEFFKKNPLLFVSKNNQKITNNLDKEHYNKLVKIANSSRYELYDVAQYFDTIRTSRIIQFLKHDKELMRTNLFKVNNYSPEMDFISFAKQNNIDLFPIEKAEDIKNYSLHYYGNEFDNEKLTEILKKEIDNYHNEDYIDLFKRYSNHNLDLGSKEILKDSIMILRNKRMANKIDSIIQNKKAFILVGASHLPFDNGILNLLSKKGYSIEPLEIDIDVKSR